MEVNITNLPLGQHPLLCPPKIFWSHKEGRDVGGKKTWYRGWTVGKWVKSYQESGIETDVKANLGKKWGKERYTYFEEQVRGDSIVKQWRKRYIGYRLKNSRSCEIMAIENLAAKATSGRKGKKKSWHSGKLKLRKTRGCYTENKRQWSYWKVLGEGKKLRGRIEETV